MNSVLLRAAQLVALVAAALAPAGAQAQPYPNQPIRIVVPNPAGGLPDTLSRIVGRRLQERIGQPVVIENRPGANAGIGAAALTLRMTAANTAPKPMTATPTGTFT